MAQEYRLKPSYNREISNERGLLMYRGARPSCLAADNGNAALEPAERVHSHPQAFYPQPLTSAVRWDVFPLVDSEGKRYAHSPRQDRRAERKLLIRQD